MSQITTLTFFRYQGIKNKLWAFGMMQFAHKYLKRVQGLSFYKLLGTGKGSGFNPMPDYSTYAFLQVWKAEIDADYFFKESMLMEKYRNHASEQWTVFMKSIKAVGHWSGQNPFEIYEREEGELPHLAIITRATIKKRLLWKFWNYVPISEKPLVKNNGLIYTKGIGEVPFMQMATFSLWKDEASLRQFAYKSKEHGQAIKLTRSLNWYKEEMFTRFKPYKSIGSWMGVDPLAV
ncbi:MAG: DUF3291 domain-containing protein [Bacteroidota bacterium]